MRAVPASAAGPCTTRPTRRTSASATGAVAVASRWRCGLAGAARFDEPLHAGPGPHPGGSQGHNKRRERRRPCQDRANTGCDRGCLPRRMRRAVLPRVTGTHMNLGSSVDGTPRRDGHPSSRVRRPGPGSPVDPPPGGGGRVARRSRTAGVGTGDERRQLRGLPSCAERPTRSRSGPRRGHRCQPGTANNSRTRS